MSKSLTPCSMMDREESSHLQICKIDVHLITIPSCLASRAALRGQPTRQRNIFLPDIHSRSLLQTPGLEDGVLGLWCGRGGHGETHLVQGGSLGAGGAGRDVAVSIAVRRVVPITIDGALNTWY